MPAQIAVVHDDAEFLEQVVTALRAAGYGVVAFLDSMAATCALDHPRNIELLITRVRFAEGTPHGAALARMALVKRPGIKVLFVSFPEVEIHTEGIGDFLPRPFSQEDLLAVVGRMLDQSVSKSPPANQRRWEFSRCEPGCPPGPVQTIGAIASGDQETAALARSGVTKP